MNFDTIKNNIADFIGGVVFVIMICAVCYGMMILGKMYEPQETFEEDCECMNDPEFVIVD